MKLTPHPFQQVGIDHALSFLRVASRGERQLYAAPTGCGKSVVERYIQMALDNAWIVTPREEIIDGIMEKSDLVGDPLDHRISTPVKLRNRLMAGAIPYPSYLIFDEGHHQEAEVWQQILFLCGLCPSLAFTATPYRGSPRSTRDFLEHWGDPIWLISYKEAIQAGYISMPRFSVLPLVDDDIVDVTAGDFSITSLDAVTVDRLGDMAEHSRQWYTDRWDRPTIYALPSGEACIRLQGELARRGMPSAIVSAGTAKRDRKPVFEAVKAGVLALLHINIVSEGVDLPLRRLVDMAPTLSPVKWVQQLGRITRPILPGEQPPEYICTNRNIARHAYALDGVVPTHSMVAAEAAFPQTTRAHTRVLGLEAIGRFKPIGLKLLSGANAYLYAMSVVVENAVVEYCALVPPTSDPVWASRVNVVQENGKLYNRWQRCEPPTDIRGFASVGQKSLSEKQSAWWRRSSAGFGLDPNQEVNRKNFQALPVLADLGVRLA